MLGLFGRISRLPLSSLLDEWNVLLSVFIPCSNEYRSTFAPDEYICFFVYCYAVLVKMEMVPLTEVFPRLINDVGKLVNVSACVARFDNCGKGSWLTCFALHESRFATPTCLLDERKMGMCASFLLSLLT